MRTRVALGKYCVYKHFVGDTLIYVGQGLGYRPYAAQGRNEKWYRLTKKAKHFDVEIVATFDDQNDAIAFEKNLILSLKPPANYIHNKKQYQYQSKRNFTVDFQEPILDRKTNKIYRSVHRTFLATSIPKRNILKELTSPTDASRFIYNFRQEGPKPMVP